jgi:hypothetical protein
MRLKRLKVQLVQLESEINIGVTLYHACFLSQQNNTAPRYVSRQNGLRQNENVLTLDSGIAYRLNRAT